MCSHFYYLSRTQKFNEEIEEDFKRVRFSNVPNKIALTTQKLNRKIIYAYKWIH